MQLFLDDTELNAGLYEGEVRGRRLFGDTQVVISLVDLVGFLPVLTHYCCCRFRTAEAPSTTSPTTSTTG